MNRQKVLLRIVLITASIGAGLGIYARTTAQEGIDKYLGERLRGQGVPVSSIVILTELPLRLQIVIQSSSDTERAMPEDPVHLHLARREVLFASRDVQPIDSFVRILENQKGAVLYSAEMPVDTAVIQVEPHAATLSNEATRILIDQRLALNGTSIVYSKVEDLDQFQSVELLVSTASRAQAEQDLPNLIGSLRPTLAQLNGEGAQIAICKLQVLDQEGRILVNYLQDLQLRSETWWVADGFDDNWGPRPLPE